MLTLETGGHGKVLPPPLTPVMTPTTLLFLTTLAASQAAGVAAIRLSLINHGGHQVEELNSKGERIVGFILYAVGDVSPKKAAGVAVMQIGSSSRTPSPFTPAQQSAWGLIANELKQFRASNTSTAVETSAGEIGAKMLEAGDGPFWIEVTATYLDCAGAILEGFLNPITDAACVLGVTAGNWEMNTSTDIPPDPPPDPDPPTDPDPIDDGTDQQTSQDGNSTGPDGGSPDGGAGCFVEGTRVHVSGGGWVPIERIDIESKLLSCDTDAGKTSIGTVTRLFKATSAEIITIVLGEEKLRCTPRHRFFTDSGWLAARHLSPGIKVRSLDGEMRPILAISIEPAEVPVFNMRVDSQHTYFVGEAGYLVHNEKDIGEEGDGTGDDDDPGSTEDKKRSLKQKAQPATAPATTPTT
jgi:Pretoxin HINT domain